jgi:hypothetical protein
MYILDYKKIIDNNIVPDKRTPIHSAWLNALAGNEIQRIHNSLFITYKQYSTATEWIAGTYLKGQVVNYNKAVFQSLENNNSDSPSNSTKWKLISENFLGTDFRLMIKGETLILEYAINTWFGTVFRQPPLVSDIFFKTNKTLPLNVFRVAQSERNSSVVYFDKSSEYIVNAYSFANQYNSDLNIPIGFYNSLGADDLIRESIVRSFVDKYINVGLTYRIATY